MKKRLALITGRRAEHYIRRIAQVVSENTGFQVDVIVAPYDVAALIPQQLLRKILSSLYSYDYIIVPGTLEYDVSGLAKDLSIKVIRGPRDPELLALIASTDPNIFSEMLEKGVFDYQAFASRIIEKLADIHASQPAIDLCGIKVPIRPPPFTIIAEVYAKTNDADKLSRRVNELMERGADIVVVGFGSNINREEALTILRHVSDYVGPIGVDSSDTTLLVNAAEKGYACLYFSATPVNRLIDKLPRGSGAVAVIPLLETGVPADPLKRVDLVIKLAKQAEKKGLQPLGDAILEPPLMGLASSLHAFQLLSQKLPDTPLMAGIANVYELMDADTHGVIAALAAILGEIGVSVLLASEESRKAYMAVTETAVAATMISIAMAEKRLPKDLGIDLLVVKEKKEILEPKKPQFRAKEVNATYIAKWYGLRLDPLGDHIILVDPSFNEIVDYHLSRRRPIVIKGDNAKDMYKAITYLGLATEPSHYAYLGYELCRAELALRFRRSYVQDQDVIKPLWEKAVFYSTRMRRVVETYKKTLRMDPVKDETPGHGETDVEKATHDTQTRETFKKTSKRQEG